MPITIHILYGILSYNMRCDGEDRARGTQPGNFILRLVYFKTVIHEIGHTLNMHHDHAFNRGHDPYNENYFENKKLVLICTKRRIQYM